MQYCNHVNHHLWTKNTNTNTNTDMAPMRKQPMMAMFISAHPTPNTVSMDTTIIG